MAHNALDPTEQWTRACGSTGMSAKAPSKEHHSARELGQGSGLKTCRSMSVQALRCPRELAWRTVRIDVRARRRRRAASGRVAHQSRGTAPNFHKYIYGTLR